MAPIEFVYQNKNKSVILFIHGFTGGIDTWKNAGNSFPGLLLEDEKIKDFYDVAYINYYTQLIDAPKLKTAKIFFTKWFNSSTSAAEKNIGINKLGDFLKSIIDLYCDAYENIIIIAHSMGGLVTKSYILKTIEYSKVKLFLSLAVPHKGSDLATFGKTLLKNQQIIDLSPLSKTLTEINASWTLQKDNLPKTIYFYGHFDEIVTETSAVPPELGNPEKISCPDDHLSITKPKANTSMVFVGVKKKLMEFMAEHEIRKRTKIQSFKDSGQYDNEIFVLKLLIADIHNTIISEAKETFFNAEYMRKFLYEQGMDLAELESLYTKIRHLYASCFLKLISGQLKDSTNLISYIYDSIKKEDKESLKSSLPLLEAYHKTGMLHQLANDLEKEIWWAANHSFEDIEKFRKARDDE